METPPQPELNMLPDEETFYKIEAYLRGRLSPADRTAFESELAADTDLAAIVHRQEQENQALERLAERDLRARMNAWEREAPVVLAPTGGRYRLAWVRWAAAAVVVLAAGWWFLLRPPADVGTVVIQPVPPPTTPLPRPLPKSAPVPPRPERRSPATQPRREVIVQAPKTTPPATVTPPRPNDNKPVDYAALADEFYRPADFAARPGADATKAMGVKELLAQSLLKSRQYDAAVPAFQEIVRSGKQPYADRAEWALALVYLHQMPRRKVALDQVLRSISGKPGHAFYARGKALQARLGGR